MAHIAVSRYFYLNLLFCFFYGPKKQFGDIKDLYRLFFVLRLEAVLEHGGTVWTADSDNLRVLGQRLVGASLIDLLMPPPESLPSTSDLRPRRNKRICYDSVPFLSGADPGSILRSRAALHIYCYNGPSSRNREK